MLLQGVHIVEGSNNERLFANAARSACKKPFGNLEFVAGQSSGGKEP
jgi:hypothetical protein